MVLCFCNPPSRPGRWRKKEQQLAVAGKHGGQGEVLSGRGRGRGRRGAMIKAKHERKRGRNHACMGPSHSTPTVLPRAKGMEGRNAAITYSRAKAAAYGAPETESG